MGILGNSMHAPAGGEKNARHRQLLRDHGLLQTKNDFAGSPGEPLEKLMNCGLRGNCAA
jgi:hypothetical protein